MLGIGSATASHQHPFHLFPGRHARRGARLRGPAGQSLVVNLVPRANFGRAIAFWIPVDQPDRDDHRPTALGGAALRRGCGNCLRRLCDLLCQFVPVDLVPADRASGCRTRENLAQDDLRRVGLHLFRKGGAGRDFARSVRRAAGRRHRDAAGLCARYFGNGPVGAGHAARRAGDRGHRHRHDSRPLSGAAPRRMDDVYIGRPVRRGDLRVCGLAGLPRVAGGADRTGRLRHDQRLHSRHPGPAPHPGLHAWPGFRR